MLLLVCDESHLGCSSHIAYLQIDVLVFGGLLIVCALIVYIVFRFIKRYERKRLRRLSKTTRIDVGDSDVENEEEEKSTSPTPDVIE